MKDTLTKNDLLCLYRAIELALLAESEGNLPIGAVVSFNDRIVAEGRNAIWSPEFNPIRHAEIEALQKVPQAFWENSRQLTLYTTLEPCLMCAGAVLQHSIGRILFGSLDQYGGAGCVFGQMPPYFEEQLAGIEWLGPILPEKCDPLYQRIMEIEEKRRGAA